MENSEITRSPVVKEIIHKLFNAKKSLGTLPLDGYNPHYKSNYTKLPTILRLLNPLLERENLFLSRESKIVDNKLVVFVTIYDVETGKSMVWQMESLVTAGMNHQNVASAANYNGRILLIWIMSVPQEDDDDGNSAAGRPASTTVGGVNTSQGATKGMTEAVPDL